MQIAQIAQLKQQKQHLQKRREEMVKTQLRKRHKAKVNLDQSAVKKGYIEKTKHIEKKQYETKVEKTKATPIEIQDNVNPNTFLRHSGQTLKTIARTRQRVIFDKETLERSVKAISAYATANNEKVVTVTLTLLKEIQCQPSPFLVELPQPQPVKQVVIVLPEIKEKQDHYAFQSIENLNLQAMAVKEFISKFNEDKVFSRRIAQQDSKCLVKFELFRDHKFFKGLLEKGVPIFPIDTGKVPYVLHQKCQDFSNYISYICQHYFAIARSGLTQTFKLRNASVECLISNIPEVTTQMMGVLISRSKNKGSNGLLGVQLKTASSIGMNAYVMKQ